MKINYSNSVKKLPPYLFAEIDRKKKELIDKGIDIISFGVGDPDTPAPEFIIDAMKTALDNPVNHQYPFGSGKISFRKAASAWLKKRFNVDIDPITEIHALIGSKEGIAHFPLAFLNPGDIVLVPEPGYPAYNAGVIFAGGESYFMPLLEKNNFLPDLESIPSETAKRAKIMYVNYPNNPTAALCGEKDFIKMIEFAKKYDIIIAHDAAYSEMYYDGKRPISFLSAPGAKDVGVEFHSLSKTFNMTGWRIGFVAGNRDIIKGLSIVKDNYDSGVFGAVQDAAVTALEKGDAEAERLRNMYQKRRDFFIQKMKSIGWNISCPGATFYVWAKAPDGYTSAECAAKLLDKAGIVVTPGNGFGPSGEGYVRFTLTVSEKRIEEAVERIKKLNR
ncbi:MAG: LL-diaminopimelate aminotransferase [Elusimicrobiota bacterium]